MKREITREKNLPSFKIDIAELSLLWTKILSLFNESSEIRAKLEVNLPSETIVFKDIDEIADYQDLPAKLTKFSMFVFQGKMAHLRYLHLRQNTHIYQRLRLFLSFSF